MSHPSVLYTSGRVSQALSAAVAMAGPINPTETDTAVILDFIQRAALCLLEYPGASFSEVLECTYSPDELPARKALLGYLARAT